MTAGLWVAFVLLTLNATISLIRSVAGAGVAVGLATQIAALLFTWAAWSVWNVIP